MDKIAWDPKFKACYDSIDLYKDSHDIEVGDFAKPGILQQIGCDFTGFLMDVMKPTIVQPSVGVKPAVAESDNVKHNFFTHRTSRLTAQEQKQYLELKKHFDNTNVGDTGKVVSEIPKGQFHFKTWQRQVMMEQSEFADCAFEKARQDAASYNYIHEYVYKFVSDSFIKEIKRLHTYSPVYSNMHSMFNIAVMPFMTDPDPTCQELPVLTGQPQHIANITKQQVVTAVPQIKLGDDGKQENPSNSLLNDPNIEKLISKWQPDVVISMSALRTLSCNLPPYLNQWELPVMVKEVTDPLGQQRTVVIVEKALPSISQIAREKNHLYFKKAVKQMIRSQSGEIAEDSIASRWNEQPHVSFVEERRKSQCGNAERTSVYDPISHETSDVRPQQEVNSSTSQPEATEATHLPGKSGVQGASSVEFSDSSDDETLATKQQRINFPAQVVSTKHCKMNSVATRKRELADTSSDSDVSHLVIDDSLSDSSMPQLDGASDRKVKGKSRAKGSSVSEGKVVKNEKSSTEKGSSLQADMWKQSFSGKSQTAFPKTFPANAGGASVFTKSWRKKSGTAETASDAAAQKPGSNDEDQREKDNQGGGGDGRESPEQSAISYSMAEDSVYASQLNKAVSLLAESSRSASAAGNSAIKRATRSRVSQRRAASTDSEGAAKTPSSSRSLRVGVGLFGRKSRKRKADTEAPPPSAAKQDVIELDDDDDDEVSLSVLRQKLKSPVAPVHVKQEKLAPTNQQLATVPQAATPTRQNIRTFPAFAATALAAGKHSTQIRIKQKPRAVAKNTTATTNAAAKTAVSDGASVGAGGSTTNDVLGQILQMQGSSKTSEKRSEARSSSVDAAPQFSTEPRFDELLLDLKKRPDGKPCFYSLWLIGGKRVLIRGCLHGKSTLRPPHSQTSYECHVAIRTKLEYQLDIGYEQLTVDESCREWLDLFFRPQPCVVLRCRVDPMKSQVVQTDVVFGLAQLKKESEGNGFSFLKVNKLLTVIFGKLTNRASHPPGSYLVRHKRESHDIITRYDKDVKPSKTVVYDLGREYANAGRFVTTTPFNVPWVTLDPCKSLPWQTERKRIPMTFEPKARAPVAAKKKQNKGKKKKKKKK